MGPLSPMPGPVGAPPPFVRLLVGALLSLIPGLVGAPPPLVRRLVGAALPCALPLPVAPRLRAPSFLVAALPPALVLVGLRRHLCPGSWALLRPLCDCLWALRRLLLRLPRRPFAPSRCCLAGFATSCSAVRGSLFAHASARGCSAARGRFAAYCDAAPGRFAAPCAVSLGCRVAFCSAACGAPLWLLPGPVGATPPPARLLVLLLMGALQPVAVPLLFAPVLRALSCEDVVLPLAPFVLGLPCCLLLGLWALVCPLCDVPWLSCCLSIRRSSSLTCYAPVRSPMLGPVGAAVCFAAPGRCRASCAILCGLCAASCSSARGGLLSLVPGPVGAPPAFVRPLVGALLPCALPYLIAPLLLSFVCCVSRLLCRLLLLRSWGSAAALAWACGRSSALCATARARFAACAALLSGAPLLGALSFDVTVPPPALLLPRLRYRLSSQVLPRP